MLETHLRVHLRMLLPAIILIIIFNIPIIETTLFPKCCAIKDSFAGKFALLTLIVSSTARHRTRDCLSDGVFVVLAIVSLERRSLVGFPKSQSLHLENAISHTSRQPQGQYVADRLLFI